MTPERIPSLSCWQGAISLEPLTGGITNQNCHVRDGDESFMVRLCEDRTLLGIDRRNCRGDIDFDYVQYADDNFAAYKTARRRLDAPHG